MGLLITLGLGVFVVIGAAIAGCAKEGSHIADISVAVALGAISVLLIFDLIPEVIEGIEEIGWYATVLAIALGFAALALLDRFLPEASDSHADGHHHSTALHISVATAIALTIHNIIEGMSVYGVASQSATAALMLAFGIGIHNLPLGMIVYSGVRGQSLPRRIGIVAVTALSTFAGGLIMFLLGADADIRVVHFMIALTVGLLLYIINFELIGPVLRSQHKTLTVWSVIAGAAVVMIGIGLASLA